MEYVGNMWGILPAVPSCALGTFAPRQALLAPVIGEIHGLAVDASRARLADLTLMKRR